MLSRDSHQPRSPFEEKPPLDVQASWVHGPKVACEEKSFVACPFDSNQVTVESLYTSTTGRSKATSTSRTSSHVLA